MASDSLPTPPSATPTPASAPSGSQPADAATAAGGASPAPATVAPPPTPAEVLEGLLQQITTSNSPPALAGTLRVAVGTPEAREAALAGLTSTGADPLEALDPAQHTIGVLFILSARLTTTTAPAVPFAYINTFCRNFNPEEARLVPERVTMLAKGIVQRAEALGSDKAAIVPLYDLLMRFAPDLSYLTPIHPIFVTACSATCFFTAALPVLEVPISQISTTLYPDLRYQDHLVYHYTGGIVFTALRRYADAAEFFELCASAPYANLSPSDPSIFQVEAAKKLLLVQLILHGKTLPLPKYTHPTVSNLKGGAYNTLARVYPNIEQVRVVATKEQPAFAADDNVGLLRLVVERAPRWAIRKLTETYLTLSLPEIGRVAGIEDVEEVRRVVLSMIETGEIDASIDTHGSVTFADDEPAVASKAEIDRVLRVAQEQEQVLRKLEREIARNKDYLHKVCVGCF
ncbi:hypothetical protein BJV78DRAFT_1123777 [Lactifluus subvellereus]|nr:hypothetical protein BJV78DRAFT_1123777 [Lactifluus subvellereus]